MHARQAMKLFELVQSFDAEVMLRNENGVEAEASSVIVIIMLDSAQGNTLKWKPAAQMKPPRWLRWLSYSKPGLMKNNAQQ